MKNQKQVCLDIIKEPIEKYSMNNLLEVKNVLKYFS